MHKKVLTIIFSILISIASFDVWALDIDSSRVCSLSGLYNFGDKALSGANVYLYKLADVSGDLVYTYTNEYKGFDKDINKYTASAWGEYALDVAKYIKSNEIKEDNSSKTDSDGKYFFNQLTTGLYLVIIDSVEDGNYRYAVSPTLISIPNYNMITNQYMYDLSVVMKTEASTIQTDNPNIDNKTEVPNTYDAIISYVVLFVVALLVLVITVCYINKKRKDVKKNEKNDEKKHEENS